MFAVQDAIANYAVLLHHLWPLDQSALIMNKVLVKYRWLAQADDMKTRADIIASFFNNVLRANSKRAANREAVLCFNEQEATLKTTMAKFGLAPEFGGKVQSRRENKPQRPTYSAQAQSKPQKPRYGPIMFNNTKVCFGFNSLDGRECRSTPTATGCKDKNGVEYAHVCSKYLTDKNKHCFMAHKRRDHK